MDSDSSDGDIFLTQNKFSQELPSTADACELYLDMTEEYNVDVEKNQPVYIHSQDSKYENISSDDDEQLCTALTQAESDDTYHNTRIRGIVSDEEIHQKGMKSLAKSTHKKIEWAMKLFGIWKNERNKLANVDKTISYIHPEMEHMTNDELNFCISRFLCEIKKTNGEEYPGQTLYEIVIQFQLFLEQNGKKCQFLNEECFVQIRNTLDNLMKERSSAGIGTEKRKAQIITFEEEKLMWERGILGMHNPKRLLETLIYLIGLNFAFRAGKEHRNLRWKNSQLTIVKAEDGEECLRYKEDVSKSNQGGLASRKIKQKIVYAYRNKEYPERCIISFYKVYVEHCPEDKPEGAFYLRPILAPKGSVWYTCSPVGIHQLQGTVGRLCSEAGLGGIRTNHSLRATAATRMYEAGLDEQLITEVTGHRSDCVREYKRTNEAMKRHANSIINSSQPKVRCSEPVSHGQSETAGPYNLTININVNK